MIVSVITATIGRPELERCIASVQSQILPANVTLDHIVVTDNAPLNGIKSHPILDKFPPIKRLDLPHATGEVGGRIYAMGTFLAQGQWIMNLDDDNWIDPHHIASLLEAIGSQAWAFALRKIVKQGKFQFLDECESLGPLHPIWESASRGGTQEMVDTNCYFIRTDAARRCAAGWAPGGTFTPVNDRVFYQVLRNCYPRGGVCTKKHTVNYEVNEEVRLDYFRTGNTWMRDQYGKMPWVERDICESGITPQD
jgi:glycosyltransferase involved in cell wall biosynthesis